MKEEKKGKGRLQEKTRVEIKTFIRELKRKKNNTKKRIEMYERLIEKEKEKLERTNRLIESLSVQCEIAKEEKRHENRVR